MADTEKNTSAVEEKSKETPKKSKKDKSGKKSFGSKIAKFFRDYKSELTKIVWPSKSQLLNNTGVVVAAIVVMCLFIFALDTVFSFFVKFLAGVQ